MEIGELKQTFNDRVFKGLVDLHQGEEIIIEKDVKPENREAFIESVKMFIYLQIDHFYGFVIEFSNDMSKVRKNGIWL